jgi:hypothetical protein
MLILKEQTEKFNLDEVKRGTLIYAKHCTWKEPEKGFVVCVNEKEMIVQYLPAIGNVTNHFFLPVEEIAGGEWELRYTNDMQTIMVYPEGDENDETETVDL